MASIAVCIPTIRPNSFADFIRGWDKLFQKHDVNLFVMQDQASSDKTIEDLCKNRKYNVSLFCHKDLTTQFIPHDHSDMIRSWLFWHARYADFVLTLDDDVAPQGDPIQTYLDSFAEPSVLSPYLSIGALTTSGLQMRGFPYKDRKPAEVAIQYGGWDNVLDYDAATQLAAPRGVEWFQDIIMPVPKGAAFTGCIMNCMFDTEYTVLMWQLPLLDGRYNRVGDIWSALFAKKVLDHLGKVVLVNGKATVSHQRASDPYHSLQKEAPSIWLNDYLWEHLKDPVSHNIIDAYTEVTDSAAEFFRTQDPEYADFFLKARDEWTNLFR